MITLYGWGPMFGCPSPSPFVMKSDIQLQMLGLAFDRAVADLDSVSKHKAPYVRDGETLIEDSNFIRAHFEAKLGRGLDDGLSDAEKAASWAFERMAEDHLAKTLSCERWLNDANFAKGPAHFFADVPEPAREGVIAEVRGNVAAALYGGGFGRHSVEERLQLAERDIAAIALQLGDKAYLFGDEPTVADASVAAVLISAATPFFDTPLVDLARRHANLVAYMDRMRERYLAEAKWPEMVAAEA